MTNYTVLEQEDGFNFSLCLYIMNTPMIINNTFQIGIDIVSNLTTATGNDYL